MLARWLNVGGISGNFPNKLFCIFRLTAEYMPHENETMEANLPSKH
jgi:hypothetical protein